MRKLKSNESYLLIPHFLIPYFSCQLLISSASKKTDLAEFLKPVVINAQRNTLFIFKRSFCYRHVFCINIFSISRKCAGILAR